MQTLTPPAAFVALLVATAAAAQSMPPFAVAKCDAEAITLSVRLPRAVVADGKPLAAGIYQIRVTSEHPTAAVGQSPSGECWVDFLAGGAVAGREMASAVSEREIGSVAKGPEPKPNTARVDQLKGGEYLRVWINRAGTHYIVNMPVVQ